MDGTGMILDLCGTAVDTLAPVAWCVAVGCVAAGAVGYHLNIRSGRRWCDSGRYQQTPRSGSIPGRFTGYDLDTCPKGEPWQTSDQTASQTTARPLMTMLTTIRKTTARTAKPVRVPAG